MIDLWTLFVENVFGSYHLAVFGLCGLILIILMIGGVSLLTNLYFNVIFLGVMYLGYGQRLIMVLISILLITWTLLQLKGFIDRSGGNY
jgi:hypothetical protein